MIRFIDLRGQDTAGRFAFFDTITDRFDIINDVSVWNTFEELEKDFGCDGSGFEIFLLERYRKLCPDWVFGILELVTKNILDGCVQFTSEDLSPQYVIMSVETKVALIKEMNADANPFIMCGLKVVIDNTIEYGDVKVVGEPWFT